VSGGQDENRKGWEGKWRGIYRQTCAIWIASGTRANVSTAVGLAVYDTAAARGLIMRNEGGVREETRDDERAK
jgi:hypothetical protein